MRWPTTKAENDYLAERQKQNVSQSSKSKAETWAHERLLQTGLKWTRQARWGYRLFDFWNSRLGVAVEIDGPEHDRAYDAARDRYNFKRSGIIVLRVKNFDQLDMLAAIATITHTNTWAERRASMNLKAAKKAKSGKDKLKARET